MTMTMTNKEYIEKEKHIWEHYVPSRGQAETVQGELLRALAKLQDEAQRNGNINWDEGHEILAVYIRNIIEDSKMLSDKELKQFKDDIDTILVYTAPYTEDDLYTRLAHIIVDFFVKFPEPIKHKTNPDLKR